VLDFQELAPQKSTRNQRNQLAVLVTKISNDRRKYPKNNRLLT
jgi:hypothetical protein